jgi:DNA-3-methyladenine glycosylase II
VGVTYRRAASLLAERDPVLARLVAEAGPPILPRSTESHFATLVRSIMFQQIGGAAARAIHGRLVAEMDGEVTPERLLALTDEDLRAAGLSMNKVAAVRDLAGKVLDGTVVLDSRVARLGDDEVVTRLSTVRGIGRWTAEMFLIFQLRRLDVWPVGDLAVRTGFGLAWGIPTPTPKELDGLGEKYRPYRTVVAWYCWQVAATVVPVGNGDSSQIVEDGRAAAEHDLGGPPRAAGK